MSSPVDLHSLEDKAYTEILFRGESQSSTFHTVFWENTEVFKVCKFRLWLFNSFLLGEVIYSCHLHQWLSKCGPGLAAAVSPGNQTEMHILRPGPRHTESVHLVLKGY
ncbi:uncharacterized protein [Tursiops truncatus]|uniref:uncharacterized protein isoform X2 n=1 Tax=Tursiops truncatus TaxID=9739 RepID=UPI003CCF1AD4